MSRVFHLNPAAGLEARTHVQIMKGIVKNPAVAMVPIRTLRMA